jgi:hypothetical protein
MITNQNTEPAPGWTGGFAGSNPAFAYPNPDLTSLPMLDNMANINLLQRQQGVEWPEFSWLTVPGDQTSRCFQMFAPYISRIGYTNKGRVYSIICPQQGVYIEEVGYMNVEVTVTGQRGWVDESTRELAAEMTVEGKVWFGPSLHRSSVGSRLLALCTNLNHPFPSKKANAIIVTTHASGNPMQPIFPVRTGVTQLFESPVFAQHPQAWSTANIEVEIGPIQRTENYEVDTFNELVMELFNLVSGNMLLSGNLLSWNVWFTAPQLVDKEEWRDHAEKWRKSIDEDHGSPDGPGTIARHFDGSPFHPLVEEDVNKAIDNLFTHITHHR